jgi:hypothetical protein
MLELGVYSGASIRVWLERYPSIDLVGFDINEAPPMLHKVIESGRVEFVRGDQRDDVDLDRCGKGFDVIIDDASHVGGWSRESFMYLFPSALKPSGLYFIEDYGTGYIGDFFDGMLWTRPQHGVNDKKFPSHDAGMVGWIKSLVDEMHVPAIAPNISDRLPISSIYLWQSIALVTKLA